MTALVIAVGAFEPFYLRMFTIDRTRLRASLIELPYRKLPGLRELLVETRERTRDGDVIAIVAPYSWDQGYEYVYARSLYTLAGRHPQRYVGTAQWICAYGGVPAIPGFDVVWRSREGVLMRRQPLTPASRTLTPHAGRGPTLRVTPAMADGPALPLAPRSGERAAEGRVRG